MSFDFRSFQFRLRFDHIECFYSPTTLREALLLLRKVGKRLRIVAGASYQLSLYPLIDRARFSNGDAEVEIQPSRDELVSWKLKREIAATRCKLDMLPYRQLKLLVESIRDPRHVNFANVRVYRAYRPRQPGDG